MTKYNFELNLTEGTIDSLIMGRVKTGSKVLEFGAAHGRMTRYLKEAKECDVWIVEYSAEAAKDSGAYAESVIVGDIEAYEWLEKYPAGFFDYVIFADVLEHLYDPWKVLSSVRKLLKTDGKVLISIPNVAHSAVILSLLKDNFRYGSLGLLDDTHIRFFTKNTLDEMADRCGFYPSFVSAGYKRPEETEFPEPYADVDADVPAVLERRLHGDAYQFFYELVQKEYAASSGTVTQELFKSPAVAENCARVYVDRGFGFTEGEVSIFSFNAERDGNVFEFETERAEEIKALRFDPCGGSFTLVLEGLCTENRLNYYIENGSIGGFRHSKDNGLHIIFNIAPRQMSGRVCLRIKAHYFMTNGRYHPEVMAGFAAESAERPPAEQPDDVSDYVRRAEFIAEDARLRLKEMLMLKSDYKIIKKSGLFDEYYYLSKNPDIKADGTDLIRHYCAVGWKKGLNPNEVFDTGFYLTQYPDVKDANINPFTHYIAHGCKEGRVCNPLGAVLEVPTGFEPESADVVFRLKAVARRFLRQKDISGGYLPLLKRLIKILATEGVSGIKQRMSSAVASAEAVKEAKRVKSLYGIVPFYAVSNSLVRPSREFKTPSLCILLNAADGNVDRFAGKVKDFPYKFDLFVAATDENAVQMADKLAEIEGVTIKTSAETDVITRLITLFGDRTGGYDVAGVFDTAAPDEAWELLFSNVGHILSLLDDDAKIVYAEHGLKEIKDIDGFSGCRETAEEILLKHSRINPDEYPVAEYPEGFMFWCRTEAVEKFFSLPVDRADFAAGDRDTVSAALLRLLFVFADKEDGRFFRLHRGDSLYDHTEYEEQKDYRKSVKHKDIKVLSYYLPQFHPTPENDLWHGEGFTEWTKVCAATPLFEGHYQQHIPHPELGCYYLDSPEVLKKQADMMAKSGVYGQLFYHYWFTGKLILEKPAQMLLENRDIDMPFCFCWANENWTRRWDGNEREILLGQDYSKEDARAFIRYLIPFFKDERYITADGRPMLYIYRPSSMPDPAEYLNIWAEECAANGVAKPYVVAVLTRGAVHPADFGMDAGTERVLHDWTGGEVPDIKDALNAYFRLTGSVLEYDKVADLYMSRNKAEDFTYFRSTVPLWDNAARYGEGALCVHGSSPAKFQQWMGNCIEYTEKHLDAGKQFLLVNAWNEWAEGAHLEPDTRYGYAYLNAVGRALSNIPCGTAECSDKGAKVIVRADDSLISDLGRDADLRNRFLKCLKDALTDDFVIGSRPLADMLGVAAYDGSDCGYTLDIRKISLFAPDALSGMLEHIKGAGCSAVVPNSYGSNVSSADFSPLGTLEYRHLHKMPMILKNNSLTDKYGYKNIAGAMRYLCFVTEPSTSPRRQDRQVSVVIRYHAKADMSLLEHALFSLAAMRDCIAIPVITAQNLDDTQKAELEALVSRVPFPADVVPVIMHFGEAGRCTDLRSVALNEGLRSVKTKYAAILDYDDLLMPHAYDRLISRLEKTGKAVTFGRVYAAYFSYGQCRILSRETKYMYGNSFREFVSMNHAPTHSFLMDAGKIDFAAADYFPDQIYMEDYLLTLQIFEEKNADWESLGQNCFVGDYIHSVDRQHTLAISDDAERQNLLNDPLYITCERRIREYSKKAARKLK